jgi:hypothetical protein
MTQEEHTGDDPERRSRRAATATHASTLRLRELSVQSADWIWMHYGQFAAVMLLLAGFVVLHRALVAGDSPRIVDQLAFIATIMSAATLTVLQAVDGFALKHAVDAWAAATGPEQMARFGDAETVRWVEWGVNSFFYTLVGLMVGLFGLAIVIRTVVPRWLGGSAVLCGVGLIINGVPVGFGASPPHQSAWWRYCCWS